MKTIWYLTLAVLCGIVAVCLIVVGYQFLTGGMPRIGSLMLVSAILLFLSVLEFECIALGTRRKEINLKKLWCKIRGHRIYTDHIVMGVLYGTSRREYHAACPRCGGTVCEKYHD